jgi:glycosyltransferase involved in cell wall biosynthesis
MTLEIWQSLKHFFGGPRRSKKRISAKIRAVKVKAREELRLTGTRLTADVLAMQSSIEEIRSIVACGPKRLAVVSVLPPTESGVARFTLETFRRAGFAVDIFSAFDTPADFLNLFSNEKLRPLSIWHVQTLPFAHHKLGYHAVLVVLANSPHNLPIARALHEVVPMLEIPIFIQVHDPRLQDLAKGLYGLAFEPKFSRTYEQNAPDKQSACIKMLIDTLNVKGIVVHSDAAREIIVCDIGEKPPPIHKLFHPVFPAGTHTQASKERRVTLGTFGVPGSAKCTIETLEAFRLIRNNHPTARLIMAGYEADQFVRRHPDILPDSLEVHSSPSDATLERLMSEVDVAVQLRSGNNGESSGVIPQLLSLGKPVIVSPVGAFNEYHDAVIFGPADNQPAGIASCIEQALNDQGELAQAIMRYTEKHTASAFCDQLSAIVWPTLRPHQVHERGLSDNTEGGDVATDREQDNQAAATVLKARELLAPQH